MVWLLDQNDQENFLRRVLLATPMENVTTVHPGLVLSRLLKTALKVYWDLLGLLPPVSLQRGKAGMKMKWYSLVYTELDKCELMLQNKPWKCVQMHSQCVFLK